MSNALTFILTWFRIFLGSYHLFKRYYKFTTNFNF